MKNIFFNHKLLIPFILATIAGIISCKPAEIVVEPSAQFKDEPVTVAAQEGKFTIDFVANADWMAVSTQDWLETDPKHGYQDVKASIQVSYPENAQSSDRTAELVFKTLDGKKELGRVSVTQKGANPSLETSGDVQLGRKGGNFTVTVNHNVSLDVTIQCDWITRVETKTITELAFLASENNGAADRSAQITISGGSLSSVVNVLQKGTESVFSGGKGTSQEPFLIANLTDLKQMAEFVNAGTDPYKSAVYTQTGDIADAALEDHIGTVSNNFLGVYDGGGHKITNISFSKSTAEKGQGLFGTVSGTGAAIRNLVIDGYTNPATSDQHGAFVGTLVYPAMIENCTLEGSPVSIGSSQAGGIVGHTTGDVRNCKVTADLSFTKAVAGGIAGLTGSPCEVSDCNVSCKVNCSANSVGGIVGFDESDTEISDCTYTGALTCNGDNAGGIVGKKNSNSTIVRNCKATGSVGGKSAVGGIVGAVGPGSVRVEECENVATVTGTSMNVGGIIGYAEVNSGYSVLINRCHTGADVTGQYNVGGIMGYTLSKGDYVRVLNSVTSNCTILATGADPSNSYARVGGIVGGTAKSSTSNTDIWNSCVINAKFKSNFSGSKVNGIAGIIGSLYSAGTIMGCYCNAVTADYSCPNATITYKGGTVGYYQPKTPVDAKNFYNSANTYGASYWNGGTALSTAAFKDGTLLNNLNAIAPTLSGAATWIVGDAGFPVPSGENAIPAEDPANTIRIMAIGNSFSVDAVEQYLYEIFEEKGYNAIIGNAYIGGCTLEKHWNNENSSTASTKNSNSYRKIVRGIMSTSGSKSIAYILQDEPWDYVVYQQGGGLYGDIPSHHPYIENFNAYIKNYLKDGSYKLGYQLNWAFPKDCTNDRFDLYDKDQDKMYAACVACAKSLLDGGFVDFLIPTGTSVQNGRQTSIGDTFNRDWGHLDYNFGRYTASLTWFETITGIDANTVTWKPVTVTQEQAVICRKAVHDAILKPYEVTK